MMMMMMIMMMNCFCGMVDHREYPTRRKQNLNLRKTWVQALLIEVVE